MSDDSRLKPMPKAPKLFDFFKYRFASAPHFLRSARLALKAGHDEKIVRVCLLHAIAVIGFIGNEHGYWGAQLTNIIGRHFREPEAGFGFDESPCAHMWWTLIWPTKFL